MTCVSSVGALTRALVLLILTAPVGPSIARAEIGGGTADAKACEKAVKIVAKGHPAKKELAAFLTLTSCGTMAADALVTGLSRYTQETDPLVLEEFMHEIDNWRDRRIFNAVISLATNNAAAAPARVFAVRHLLVLANPILLYSFKGLIVIVGEVTTSDADGTTTTTGCRAALISDPAGQVAYPLPPNFHTLIQSTLASLAASGSTPTIIRNAARCAR